MKTTAKLFKSGRSQAVRLPKEFRFEAAEVKIRREGNRVVLEPLETTRRENEWAWLDDLRARLPGDFFDELGNQPEPQDHPRLERLFR